MEGWKNDLDERVKALNEGQEYVRDIIRKAKESSDNPAKRKRGGEQGRPSPPPEPGVAAAVPPAEAPAAMDTGDAEQAPPASQRRAHLPRDDGVDHAVPASEPEVPEPSPEDREAAAALIAGSVAKAKSMATDPKGKGKADAKGGK